MDFLQKPLPWFSNNYLRVQSKNCERNSFLIFFSEFFRLLSEIFFRLSGKNLQKVVKTTFCVSRGTICGLKYFFKSFDSFWIFCRNLWHGSQTSIYVSRVKIEEETVFSFFFSDFFPILSENFFRLLAKKLQEFVETTFYVYGGTICGLNFFLSFEPFWIFYRKFWHGSQNSIYVSRVKIALETVFLFFFSDFFRILSEKFFRHLSEKRQDFVKTTFYVSRGTICGLIFF